MTVRTNLGFLVVIACAGACIAPDEGAADANTASNSGGSQVVIEQDKSPPANSSAVETRFKRFVLETLASSPGNAEEKSRAVGLVEAAPLAPEITQGGFEECRAAIERAHGSTIPPDALLHGDVAQLPRDGDCWMIRYDGLMTPGLSACIDGTTGETLLVWVTPEG